MADLAEQSFCIEDEREFYRRNFYKFAKDVLGFKDMRPEPHFEMCDFMANTPGNGSNRTSNIPGFPLQGKHRHGKPDKRRGMIITPRGSFKSSICTVAYPIWRWVSDPTLRILIMSHNTEKASEFLAGIQEKLKNRDLFYLFGDLAKGATLKGRERARWNKLELQIWDPESNRLVPLDHTMASGRAVGMETQIASVHCDICIMDDLVNQWNVESEDGLAKPIETIKYIEPIVNPYGEQWIVGSRYSFLDAYGWIINNGLYDVLLRSAIYPDGRLLFPTRLTYEVLKAQEKVMGPYIASCQLYSNPVSPEEARFKPEWIQRCIVPEGTFPPNLKDLKRKAYIDPAISQSKRGDFCARGVGVNDGRACWLLEAEQGRIGVDGITDEVFRIDEHHKCEIGIEGNAFQSLFCKIFQNEEGKRKHTLTGVIPIVHSTKVHKEHRIASLVPYIKNGTIKIQESMIDLIAQLQRYPKWTDDLLDMLAELVNMLGPMEDQPEQRKTDQEIIMEQIKAESTVRGSKPPRRQFHSYFGGAF